MPPVALIDPATIDTSRTLVDQEGIRRGNPQRFEMEHLTAIVALELDRKLIVGYKDVRADEFWVRGHMPDYPLMPGVLIVEALAQTGAVLVMHDPANTGKVPFFARIDNCRFRQPVRPGDTLRLELEVTSLRGPVGKAHGRALVGQTLACEADLTFAFADAK